MISVEEWRQQGRFVELGNQRFFCIDTGKTEDRAPIVLIHGFPTSSWDWAKIWPGLAKDYPLFAMDMLGFGFSDKPRKHSYSIMEQADIIEELLQKEGIKRFHVLAHDYGDTVAQELLARQNESGREQWLSLCLLNGGLFPETHHARLVQKLLLSPIGKLLTMVSSKKQLASSFREIFSDNYPPTKEEIDSFWQLIEYNQGKRNFHKLIRYMNDRKIHRERWVSALKDARIPIALINGSVDPVSGDHMVERYLELLGEPHTLVRMTDVGHYPQVEAPEALLQNYLNFLKHLNPE